MKVPISKNSPVELVERVGTEIFKFEAPGDYLRGRLLNIETVDIGGKPTLRYVVQDEDEGRAFGFLGTMDLNTKIRPSDAGKLLEIRYEGTDVPTGVGKNPIKRFKVFAEKNE